MSRRPIRPSIFCLLACVSAWLLPNLSFALSDNILLRVTNTWNQQPVTFNLQRYSLRATNYEVRIFSDVSTYTVLPANQIPEVTTYRGRINEDTGAFVCGAFAPDGRFYFNVSYGCRWQASAANADPYDTTNRLSWGGWDYSVPSTNIPSLGYSFVWQTNMPVHVTWSTNNYPAPASPSFGGPPYLNNLQMAPLQRVRLALDSDLGIFNGIGSSDITRTILVQEARINDLDYLQARDLGLCYAINIVCVRTNTQSPYNSSGYSKLGDLNGFWSPDPAFHQVYDMVHGTVAVNGGGVAYSPGDLSIMDPSWAGNAVAHEIGHNWGQAHYAGSWDYTGDNYWHVTMSGSGYGHSIADVAKAQDLRRNSWKGNLEWVRYNYPLAPWAGADLASTKTNLPVTINVLLNDRVATSNTLSLVSVETNTPVGGTITNLGNGQLRYTPPANFAGYDLFHYYVGDVSGLKSLAGVKVLVTNDANALLAQWNFGETNGSVAADATGTGVPGMLIGATDFANGSVPGVGEGTALHLDGNSYVRFKGTWFDPLNASMSFSLWVKPDAAPTGDQMLLIKSSLNANNSSGFRIGMNTTSFYCNGATLGALKSFNVNAPVSPSPGTWYHVVVAFDRTANLVRLWVNGAEYTSTSSTRTIAAGEFIMGENWPALGVVNSSSGFGNYLEAAVDDLRLYTRVLSQAEITAMYQSAGSLPAGGPNPADGERDVALLPTFKWVPGRTNYQHDVFLGTNLAAVTAATTNSAEYVGRLSIASLAPPELLPDTQYYWRVDEILNGTNVATGPVWTFRMAVDVIHGGLKLQLTLDARDTLGNITYDHAGPPFNDATLFSTPPLTNGQVAEGMQFNGTSQYAEVPPLNFASDTATFLAWVRRNGTVSDFSGLVFHRGSSASGLDVTTLNRIGYHWNNAANTYNFNSGLALPDGQWALAVLVVETNRAILYLGTTNGVLSSATNNVAHGVCAFGSPIRLASDSSSSTRYFKGALDEVGIWNRALSRAEIGTILTNGMAGGGIDGPPPVPQPGTFTWTGNSDSSWNNAGNWAIGQTPTASSTIIFDDSSAKNLNTDLAQPFAIAGALVTGKLRAVGIASAAGNPLTLNAGGIKLSNSFTTLSLAAPITLGATQTWSVSEFAALNVSSNITAAANALTLDVDGSATLAGVVSGSGGFTKKGMGAVTLTTGAQTLTGGLTVSNGTLKIFGGQWAQSFFANVSPRAITLHSNATLETTTHSLGGLGASFFQPMITLNDGATWQLDEEQYLNGNNLTLKGATISILDNDLRVQGGTVTVNASPRPSTISGVGALTLFGATTFNVADGPLATDLTVGVPIGSSGVQNLIKSGAGTMSLTDTSTYTGTTTINGGTLTLLGGPDTLPPGTSLTINSGANLALNNNAQTVANLTGNGGVQLGYGTLTVALGGTITYGGIIAGSPAGNIGDNSNPGGITKTGPGRLTLTANQTYSGDTVINAGTLALSGSGGMTASSNLAVAAASTLDVTARTGGSMTLANGQTLKGSGSVLGAIQVGNGAAIAPGQGVGSLVTGSETWLGGGSYQWEIAHATNPGSWDILSVNGSLTVNASAGNPFTIKLFAPGGTLAGFANTTNYAWTIATTTGGVLNFDSAKFSIDPSGLGVNLGGGQFAVQQAGNNLVLAFVPATAIVAPRISGATMLPNGTFTLSGTGAVNQPYVLAGASNLIAPVYWTPIVTNTADANGLFNFSDPQATNYPQRFYRLSIP